MTKRRLNEDRDLYEEATDIHKLFESQSDHRTIEKRNAYQGNLRQFKHRLIKAVEKKPALWDKYCSDCKATYSDCWKEVADEMSNHFKDKIADIHLSNDIVAECKRIWKNLYDQLRIERKKIAQRLELRPDMPQLASTWEYIRPLRFVSEMLDRYEQNGQQIKAPSKTGIIGVHESNIVEIPPILNVESLLNVKNEEPQKLSISVSSGLDVEGSSKYQADPGSSTIPLDPTLELVKAKMAEMREKAPLIAFDFEMELLAKVTEYNRRLFEYLQTKK